MQPKRNQGPGPQRPARKPQGPVFFQGDYVPLAIIVVKDNNPQNVHLPQKLFALKDFKQEDILREYHFQHPQQPVMLDPQNPNIAAFNGAVTNFHKWCVAKGYCRSEGTSGLTVRIWTAEELAAAKVVEAERDALLLKELRDQGIDLQAHNVSMEETVDQRTPVNVGTVGHVDHGKSALGNMVEDALVQRTVSDGGQAYEAPNVGYLPETVAYLEEKRDAHPMDALLVDDRGCIRPEPLKAEADRQPDELELMYPTQVKKVGGAE